MSKIPEPIPHYEDMCEAADLYSVSKASASKNQNNH